MKEILLVPALCLVAVASFGEASDDARLRSQSAGQSQGVLFATPLLSEVEQAEYRARVRAAKDADELERIRSAHYELMKARAKERGTTLPEDRPPALGVPGNAFGPQLTTEQQRAAQRAAARDARSKQTAGSGSPVRQEQLGAGAKTAPSALPSAAPKLSSTMPVPPSAAPIPSPAMFPGIDTIFGPQLMTEEEKAAYRARLRSAKSDEERQRIRAEREQQLRMRAKERGVTLP